MPSSDTLRVYREFDANEVDEKPDEKRAQRASRRRRAPAATYGDWFDGDDAELEKMVDEFQNEAADGASDVGDRVRASVAELCGALDSLVEEDNDENNDENNGNAQSLREQLLDSWQGKSYYQRLQNIVDSEKKKPDHPSKTDPRSATVASKKPLSSIDPNVTGNMNTAYGKQKKPSSISLLQPLYKNQNYMIPQKALNVSSVTRAKTAKVLAELSNLDVPSQREELVAVRADLLKIIDVCHKKLAEFTR